MTLAVRKLFRVFSNSPEQNGRNTSYSKLTGERERETESVLSPFHTLSHSRKPTWTEIKAAQKPLLKWLLLFFVVFIVVICDSYTADLLDKVRETREYRERGELCVIADLSEHAEQLEEKVASLSGEASQNSLR